jgi:hypothetical protein
MGAPATVDESVGERRLPVWLQRRRVHDKQDDRDEDELTTRGNIPKR